jgi:NHLM bacteriocin system ABC transporter ATP-binding protein
LLDERPAAEGDPVSASILQETCRLYVRHAGPASLSSPRRFVGEFAAGSLFLPLAADNVVFELVASGSGSRPTRQPPDALTAALVDGWITQLSALTCFPYPSGARMLQPDRLIRVVTEEIVTSAAPLWIASGRSDLSLGSGLAAACLPIVEGLGVVCLGSGTVSSMTTAELLRDAGAGAVLQAADHVAAVVALWLEQTETARLDQRAETGRRDDRDWENTYRQVRDVAEGRTTQDPANFAFTIIAEKSGFTLKPGTATGTCKRFDELLSCAAIESGFRYRNISLQGQWWLEEGGPLLVYDGVAEEPRAAIWIRGVYRVYEPGIAVPRPLNAGRAKTLARSGYVLYPSLPAKVGITSLVRFALRGVRTEIVNLVLTGLLITVLGFVTPIVTGEIVSTAIPDGRASLLVHMALLAAAATFGAGTASLGRGLASIRVSSLIEIKLQAAVWDRILSLPTRFFRNYATGDLAQRVLAIDTIRRILTGPVLNGLMSGLFASASFVLMLFYDLRLAAFGVAFAVFNAVVLFFFARHQMKHLTTAQSAAGVVSGVVIDILSGVLKLRIAAAEERAFGRWGKAFAAQQTIARRIGTIGATQAVVMTLVSSLGLVAIFAIATLRPKPIDLAVFAAFSSAFGQFSASLSGFAQSFSSALEVIPLFKSAKPIFDAAPEHKSGDTDPGRLTGQIDVRGLSFRYDLTGPMILNGIDFSVASGQFVAIVGPSGSGKSTLLRLLLGFERPTAGAIFYDSRDLAKIDVRLLRRQIGTVLQSTGLTPGSLYENIAGSKPLSDAQVLEAAKRAGLEQDIAGFPMGLETIVAEGGGSLSGGQKQRVMIARALIGEPALLFFDEATSALDNRTQAIVSQSLDELSTTRLVIAHRLSTIRHADKILVMDQGRLVEQGTYAELMGREGLFYRLASRQIA